MLEQKVDFMQRDLVKDPLSEDELSQLIGNQNILLFLSQRSETFTARGYDKELPAREIIIREMVKEPNLIKRPILTKGGQFVIGFDKEKYLELLKQI